jgi:hypothetical protein
MINFEKMRMVAAVVASISGYQKLSKRYAFLPVTQIRSHIVRFVVLS